MTVSPDSVASDQLRAFVERVERLDEELKAINDDKKEVFAEAKGNGFDVLALKAVLKIRRMDHAERMEREAIVDLYLAALGMGPAVDDDEDRPSRAHVHVHEATPPHDPSTGEIIEPNSAPDVPPVTEAGGDASSSPAPIHETPAAGAPAGAAEVGNTDPLGSGAAEGNDAESAAPATVSAEPAEAEGVGMASSAPITREGAPAGEGAVPPAASSSDYAAPGVVVMEKCPPRGIVAHPYAACWPVNNIDVSGGVREPIVKMEHFILDGRGRYFAARDAGIEYPVVQYEGTDPLLDSIRWNLASRKLSEAQRRMFSHKLCSLEPERADEILALFGLDAERQAAE